MSNHDAAVIISAKDATRHGIKSILRSGEVLTIICGGKEVVFSAFIGFDGKEVVFKNGRNKRKKKPISAITALEVNPQLLDHLSISLGVV